MTLQKETPKTYWHRYPHDYPHTIDLVYINQGDYESQAIAREQGYTPISKDAALAEITLWLYHEPPDA